VRIDRGNEGLELTVKGKREQSRETLILEFAEIHED
jgi:hypothetical protein